MKSIKNLLLTFGIVTATLTLTSAIGTPAQNVTGTSLAKNSRRNICKIVPTLPRNKSRSNPPSGLTVGPMNSRSRIPMILYAIIMRSLLRVKQNRQ